MQSELRHVAQRLIEYGWARLWPRRDVSELPEQVESAVDSIGTHVRIGLKKLLGVVRRLLKDPHEHPVLSWRSPAPLLASAEGV